MNKQFFTILILLIIGSQSVIGQRCDFSGKLVAGKNIDYSTVVAYLNNTYSSTQLDSSGKFEFKEIDYGKYEIVFYSNEKNIATKEIELKSSKVFLTFYANELERSFQTVDIIGNRSDKNSITHLNAVENFGIYESKKNEVIQLNSLNANLATNNARQVYAKITGLNIWESDQAGLQLGIGGRGLSPNRTANFNVRQNGYDISADALGYPESYYTPPAEALERIEIVRGASSLQFGTQFGGMINFKFKKGDSNKKFSFLTRQSVGSWGYFSSFNSVGGTILKKKLNYYGFLLYKRADGFRPNSKFNSINGYVALEYKPTERLQINFDFTKMNYTSKQPGGLTDRNFDENHRQSVRSRNWFDVDWLVASLSASYKVSDQISINSRNFVLDASRNSLGNLERINVIDFNQNRTLIAGDFNNWGNENRLLFRYNTRNQINTLLFGTRTYVGRTTAIQGDGDATNQPNFTFLNPDNIENSDYQFKNINQALFLEHIFNLNKKWNITPGIRWEYINTISSGYYKNRVFDGAGNIIAETKVNEDDFKKRNFVIYGVGSSYKINQQTKLYANFSQNYRAINFSDLRIVNPNFIIDENIKDENGFTADLGIRGDLKKRFSYELTTFLIHYNGKIGQILRSDLPPLYLDYRFRGNIADARNFGVEAFGEWTILEKFENSNNFDNSELVDRTVDLLYSLNLFINTSFVDARYINSQDAAINRKKVEMVPPFTFKTGLQFDYKNFKSTLQYGYVQQHFTDATNAVRTSTAVEGIIPSYQVIDFTLSYRYKNYVVEGSVNNLLDEKYFTRRAESYPGPGIIPSDGRGFYLTLQGTF